MQLYKDEIDKEMILNAEIQRQNLKSLPKGGIKDRKVKNPVSQQMIDEFKQQFNKKSGDKAYLFPELKPNLIDQNDELSKIQQPLTNDQIIEATTDLNEYIKRYNLLENTMIPQHRRIIAENKDKINKLSFMSTKEKILYGNKKAKTIPNQIKNLQNEITNLENNIIRDTIRMQNYMSDINLIKEIITRNNELADNYSNLKFSIEQKNKKILTDYENNIRILNEGKINISQDPDETEEEYLIRLSELSEQEYDDSELLEKAYLSNINEFKQNMKSILSTEWKIENILNSLDREEVFLLNKTFKAFEKEFLKTFGKDNKNVEVDEYIGLIKEQIYGDDKKKIDDLTEEIDNIYKGKNNEPREEIDEGYSIFGKFDNINNGIVYDLIEEGMILQITNEEKDKTIFLLLDDKDTNNVKRVIYRYERYGEDMSFQRQNNKETFISKFLNIFRDYLEMSEEQIIELFNITNRNKNKFNEPMFSKILTSKFGLSELKFEGLGLKEKLPSFIQFGKVIILLDKLYYKNTLSIKDKNKKNIQGLPNKKVSDKFVDIIMRMIKDDKPAGTGDIYELDDKEQELFTILMYKSGFYKETTTNNKKIIQKLKDRLQLVEGEIKAGNNNDDNFKELYQIIFKMTNLGVISLSNGRSYYKQIKKEYS